MDVCTINSAFKSNTVPCTVTYLMMKKKIDIYFIYLLLFGKMHSLTALFSFHHCRFSYSGSTLCRSAIGSRLVPERDPVSIFPHVLKSCQQHCVFVIYVFWLFPALFLSIESRMSLCLSVDTFRTPGFLNKTTHGIEIIDSRLE